jgi:hypothetical protein
MFFAGPRSTVYFSRARTRMRKMSIQPFKFMNFSFVGQYVHRLKQSQVDRVKYRVPGL